MKRRLLATFLSLCLLVGLLPTVALADDESQAETAVQSDTMSDNTPELLSGSGTTEAMSGNCGATESDAVTWKLEQNNADSSAPTYTLTISGSGAMKDWGSGYGVYPADAPWFNDYYTLITHVIVEDGVTYIGNYTFGNLSNMATLSLGKDVASFGAGPFSGKSSLMTITVDPENTALKVIDGALLSADGTTLYACTNDKEYYRVPDGVTTIYRCAFSGNDNLKTIDFNQVTNIDTYAFLDAGLTEVYVPATVTTMGTGVFRAPNIESVEFYGTNLNTQTFWGCTKLKKITIGSTVQSIGANAFSGCSSIETVYYNAANATVSSLLQGVTATGITLTIGPNVQSIYNNFLNQNPTAVDELIIEDGTPISIGNNAFKGCSNITELNDTYNRIVSIGTTAFENSGLTGTLVLGNGVDTIGMASFRGTGITKLIIEGSESGVSIKGGGDNTNGAFADLSTLTTVVGRNIKEVGWGAFYGCSNLVAIDLSGSPSLNQPTTTYYQNPFKTIADNSVIYLNNSANVLTNYHYDTSKTSIAYTNGGTFAEDTVFAANTLATPTKDGAIFAGWYTDSSFSGSLETSAAAGKTYYAKWIELTTTEIPLQYQGTQAVPTAPQGVTYSAWQSEDSSIVSIEGGQLKANKVGKTTITATAKTEAGGTATLTVYVEVTPMRIIYGKAETRPDDSGTGRPYITYALNEGGTTPTFSELLGFYPVKAGNQEGTFEPDTGENNSKAITLIPGTDVEYIYVNDTSGNKITTDTLPAHPTVDGDGNPHSIPVELKLKNPNYRFCTVGTDWKPADTIILYVTCYKEGMVEVDMYLEGDTAPLETFEGNREYEYTGEGIVPTARDLTTLYTKGESTSNTITQFTAHFHAVKEGTAFSGTHLTQVENTGLTAKALKAIAPKEPGVYSFVINGYNEGNKTYCYASRRYSIVKGTPKGAPTFTQASSGVELSSVKLSGEMKNAAGAAVAGSFVWENDNQTVERGKSYTWIFTPDDTDHYNTVPGTAVVWPASSGGGSGSSNVNGSGDDVSISASGGSVTASQMESAVKKADEGAAITIKSTSSTTVTLPVGGMEKAADNDNDVRLDLRYGEITLSARAIAGMTDGISSNDKIKISITSQTSSKDETISDLLDKGAAVFDVSVTVNDVEVHSFDGTLTITLTVSNLSKITDPHILHILTSGTKEYYAPDSISGNTITVKGIRNLSTFAVIPGSEVPQNNPFADVSTSDYYYDSVLWAVENGVTNGTSATTFGPDMAVSRAQMVTFLWRAHGSPKATGANPFTDVSTSDYYYDAVLWAVANGVTNGTSATTFSPDMAVTRAQAVTFQWRAAGSPVVSGSSFGDVATDAYYVNAVTWAVANGITNGTGGNSFSPDVVVSRAQAVTFLYRELG